MAGSALLAMLATALMAQPADRLASAPQPGQVAEQVIALAVAQARCGGANGKMLARYRPRIMDARADQIRAAGSAMAQRYQQHHGDGWQAALIADLTRLRDGFEQRADAAAFCRQTAWQARRMADALAYGHDNGHDSGANRFSTVVNVESYLYERFGTR
jgi:hypothetical protein